MSKSPVILLLFAAALVLDSGIQAGAQAAKSVPAPHAATPSPGVNSVCALTNKVRDEQGGSVDMRFGVTRALGLTMVRPQAVHVPMTAEQKSNRQWELIAKNHLRNVQNFDARRIGDKATDAPTDLDAWSKGLDEAIQFVKPTLVVIENEENTKNFYNGTPEQYLAELTAAVKVAHRLGYKVTNGGITFASFVPVMVEDWIAHGQRAKAEVFAARVGKYFAGWKRPLDVLRATPLYQEGLHKGLVLLKGYKATGIDYLNFHWYSPYPAMLRESRDYLEKYTGLTAMTNEIGQFDELPQTVTDVLPEIIDLNMPYACWYDGDGKDAFGLHNADGSLRPTGEAFKKVLSEHR